MSWSQRHVTANSYLAQLARDLCSCRWRFANRSQVRRAEREIYLLYSLWANRVCPGPVVALAHVDSSTHSTQCRVLCSLLSPAATSQYTQPPPPPATSQHPSRRRRPESGRETDSPPLPGELLVDIFLRIDPADLVRASTACVSFRRLVADRSFLRQYRKIHAPLLLGFLFERTDFQPAVALHPSASAASADFSFAFLPLAPAVWWRIQDIRVLLFMTYTAFIKILVCDPLHRQYLLLPPIPEEVFTSSVNIWEIFLVPPAAAGSGDKEEEAEEETAVRVIWMARRGDNLVVLVFSSSTGQWQAGPSHIWSDSFNRLLKLPGVANSSRPQYAYGCFYWVLDTRNMVTDRREKLLVLDTRKMEFSIADAPPEAKGSGREDIAIVEAGEGRPGMFVLPYDTADLSFIIRRNEGGRSIQWQLEKTISLGFRYSFAGSAGRHLFLERNGDFFSLDFKTFQLEMVCASKYNHNMFWPRPYSNFPPSLLSSPTVASELPKLSNIAVIYFKGPGRRRWNRAVLQAQAHSCHGQSTSDVNAGAWRSG